MLVTSPNKITDEVLTFCERISPNSSPSFLKVEPAPGAESSECFENVRLQVEKEGGRIIYGWRIWEWPGVMIEVEFHSVWQTSFGEMLDITPCKGEPCLFLADNSVRYDGTTRNNIRKALSSDSDIKEFVSLTDKMYELIVTQKDNPTPENYVFVGVLLAQMAARQEYLVEQIAERHPLPKQRITSISVV